jgi:alpha-ketoglutarate-dependent taurine dioxygenase
LWASGYEIYDRISEPYQRFLEGLTATFAQPAFSEVADRAGFKLYEKERGAPENVGSELKAVHPVVRTNPVTGWKSIFPVGGHVRHINGLTEHESKHLLDWFLDLVYKGHDLTVRFKWKNPNDLGKFISTWLLVDKVLTENSSDLGQQKRFPHGHVRL